MEKFKKFWKESTLNKVMVVGAIVLIVAIIGVIAGKDKSTDLESTTFDSQNSQSEYVTEETEVEETVATVKMKNLKKYSKKKAKKWCEKHNLIFESEKKYSKKVPKGKFIKQSVKPGEEVEEYDTVVVTYSLGRKPTMEEENALVKAQSYSDNMYMSKKGIYDQLTSQYGEQFSAKAAKYAINHLDANFKKNALEKAKSYQENMNMSRQAIYDQLVSSYGEQFTPAEAQYAINHLKQ